MGISVGVPLLRRTFRARHSAHRVPTVDALVLGRDSGGKAVVLEDRQLAAHGLIVGASGAGKSTSLLALLSDAVKRGRPVIAIDMKGSPAFAHTLSEAAGSAGRRLQVWSPDGPALWNPLRHGNATELKDKLVSTERFTEPHYQRAAERYVQLALQVLQESHPERPATFAEVVAAMEPRRLAGLCRQLAPSRALAVEEYLSGLTSDQQSAIRGLGTRLAIVSESHTGRFLEPGVPGAEHSAAAPCHARAGAESEIDLRRALEGDDVVLFSLNSSVYGKLAAQLGTLAIQDLVTATGHRLEHVAAGDRPQALVGIDEFSALGADNVISLLARGRESRVSVLLATQELADLDRAAHGFRDQVLGVTAVKIVHRQDVPASAQTIAQMAGTRKVWEPTYRFGQGPFGRYDTSRGSQREAEQFVVHPNEIKSLRTGEAVLITKVPEHEVRTVKVAPPAPPAPVRTEVPHPLAPAGHPRRQWVETAKREDPLGAGAAGPAAASRGAPDAARRVASPAQPRARPERSGRPRGPER